MSRNRGWVFWSRSEIRRTSTLINHLLANSVANLWLPQSCELHSPNGRQPFHLFDQSPKPLHWRACSVGPCDRHKCLQNERHLKNWLSYSKHRHSYTKPMSHPVRKLSNTASTRPCLAVEGHARKRNQAKLVTVIKKPARTERVGNDFALSNSMITVTDFNKNLISD